jgi:hypothetical protein
MLVSLKLKNYSFIINLPAIFSAISFPFFIHAPISHHNKKRLKGRYLDIKLPFLLLENILPDYTLNDSSALTHFILLLLLQKELLFPKNFLISNRALLINSLSGTSFN